jgi:inner membrane protein
VDPLTHILLGANLGYAAFGRKLARTAAGVAGLAAFAPDIDVFIQSAADPLVAIEHHRGFTHALAFAPVGAAVVAALWLARAEWRTWARWRLLWACALLGYASHALLDAATTYGTQLWWPFSRHRESWDLIAIVDPLFTLALAAGLITALLRRHLRSSATVLMLGAGYIALGGVQHARARAAQHTLVTARGHTPERSEIMPTLGNNLVWRALYQHDGKIYSDRLRVGWFSGATVREGWSIPLVRAADLTPAERARDQRHAASLHASPASHPLVGSEHWVIGAAARPTDHAARRHALHVSPPKPSTPIWGIRFTPPGAPEEVRRRLDEIRSGKVQAVPGEEVMARARKLVGL